MTREYIAYKGQAFQIEWYYSPVGKSQALEYYQELEMADRVKVLKLFRMMGDTGKIRDHGKFRNEGDKVYAFKPQPHRFLSFLWKARKLLLQMLFGRSRTNCQRTRKNGH